MNCMRSLLIGFLLFCSNAVFSQDITGNWQGLLSAGGKQIRIVFHVSRTDGIYSGTMDSPDQGANGIKATGVTVSNDSIAINIAEVAGGYRGKWNHADEIKGAFVERSMNFPMDLKRQTAEIPAKPQTPKAPFDYIAEDVAYENKNIHLEGTLTKPKNGNKFPVVLLITGSGPQDRDETIGLHKSFFVIADYFTRQGIAVLRVDDRGAGKSTGNFATATSVDFASDVMAGIRYLKTRTDIDTAKIGLLGHSEGAMIAPYVATRSKDVSFIVMLAGPVEGGMKTMYYQAVTKHFQAYPESVRTGYGVLYNKMLEICLRDSIAKNINAYVKRVYLQWKKEQPAETVYAVTQGAGDDAMIGLLAEGFAAAANPWFRFFLTYDPQADLKRLQIPVFALNGEKDEQVNPANLALIKNILSENKNPHYKTQEVPGVNHLFQHCKNCGSVEEYLALEETFDKETLVMLGEWIKAQVK
jgi:pimeloyl-ACP methyl ester carboxylesterase